MDIFVFKNSLLRKICMIIAKNIHIFYPLIKRILVLKQQLRIYYKLLYNQLKNFFNLFTFFTICLKHSIFCDKLSLYLYRYYNNVFMRLKRYKP